MRTPDDDQALDSELHTSRPRRAVRRPGRFEDFLIDWENGSELEREALAIEEGVV